MISARVEEPREERYDGQFREAEAQHARSPCDHCPENDAALFIGSVKDAVLPVSERCGDSREDRGETCADLCNKRQH